MADVQAIRDAYQGPIVPGVMKTMLVFTILMVTGPIFCYFFSKAVIFESMMQMSNVNSWFYAAIVAVCAVHVVLAMFIYVAWTEEPSKPHKYD